MLGKLVAVRAGFAADNEKDLPKEIEPSWHYSMCRAQDSSHERVIDFQVSLK